MIEFISAVPLPRRSRFGRRDAKFHQSRRGIYAAVKAAGCRIGGVSVGVDDLRLSVSLCQSFVDEVNFADQPRSELNPLGE